MLRITEQIVREYISKSKGKLIAVIGDVMLDRYFWGSVSRVSPEAPVPVIDLERETYHLGGAANVANNLKSLGVEPLLCGLVGNDESGEIFRRIATENGIRTEGLYQDNNRPTTVKTRIIGNNQHIARLDREITDTMTPGSHDYIYNIIQSHKDLAGIIFQDYNKGALTEDLIREVTDLALTNEIPIFVDPKFRNFFSFLHSTVFKPNKKEASTALNMNINSKERIIEAGKKLLDELKCQNVLLPLGADGMMLFESNGDIFSVPTRARKVSDVSGAGDTTIATLAAVISGGASVVEAASIANFAAGVVCEEPGIVSITEENLIRSIKYYIDNGEQNEL